MGTFKASYDGIGELLRSQAMKNEMHRRILRSEEAARAAAAEFSDTGEYESSFETEVGLSKNGKRARAVLRNTSDHSLYVEFGSEHNPRHRTLGKALDAAK